MQILGTRVELCLASRGLSPSKLGDVELIRLALYLEVFSESTARNETIIIPGSGCRAHIAWRNNASIEVWSWCRTLKTLLKFIEELLQRGFLLRAIANLAGNLIPVENLDLDNLEKLAAESRILKGKLQLECTKSIRNCIRVLNVMEAIYTNINLKRKRISLQLSKPASTVIFYDHGLRVIKPIEIPPKIGRKQEEIKNKNKQNLTTA